MTLAVAEALNSNKPNYGMTYARLNILLDNLLFVATVETTIYYIHWIRVISPPPTKKKLKYANVIC